MKKLVLYFVTSLITFTNAQNVLAFLHPEQKEELTSAKNKIKLDTTAIESIKSIDAFHQFVTSEKFEQTRSRAPRNASNSEVSPIFYQQAEKLITLLKSFCSTEDDDMVAILKKEFRFHRNKMDYDSLINLCFFTSFLMPMQPQQDVSDPIHQQISSIAKNLGQYGYSYESYVGHAPILVKSLAASGCISRFFPFVLIGNNSFHKDVYLYALSKRVFLLSLPSQSCEGIHGGLYKTPPAILFHDYAHVNQFCSWRQGLHPFFYQPDLDDKCVERKHSIFESVGRCFYNLLQTLDRSSTEYKRVREVGFNLTHEVWTQPDTFTAEDNSPQDYVRALIKCLKINLTNDFLPDSLTNNRTFLAILPKSREIHDQLKSSVTKPLDFDQVKFEVTNIQHATNTITIDYTMHIPNGEEVKSIEKSIVEQVSANFGISYDFSKRNRSDWVKSLKCAGYNCDAIYTGADQTLDYNPTAARHMHFDLLDWFTQTYLQSSQF